MLLIKGKEAPAPISVVRTSKSSTEKSAQIYILFFHQCLVIVLDLQKGSSDGMVPIHLTPFSPLLTPSLLLYCGTFVTTKKPILIHYYQNPRFTQVFLGFTQCPFPGPGSHLGDPIIFSHLVSLGFSRLTVSHTSLVSDDCQNLFRSCKHLDKNKKKRNPRVRGQSVKGDYN